MKKIRLTNSAETALVSDEDYEKASRFNWYRESYRNGKRVYARATVTKKNIRLHRLLFGHWPMVDHKDGNGLNNQRDNIRPCTGSQNNANSKKQSGCFSKFKGVSWNTRRNKWCAYIKVEGKSKHLGNFESESKAALAYNEAAVKLFGEFAKVNLL